MANDQKIQLTVQVNAETGQLEVLGSKFAQLGQGAGNVQNAFAGLSGEAGGLLRSFLPIATATGIIGFFAESVRAAEEENESLRRLAFTLQSTGQSWEANKGNVVAWAKAIQDATRFSDSEALGALEKLARSTGSLTQGQKASKLAMDLSVSSGKSLAETTEIVNTLLQGQQRSILMAAREFGSYTDGAKTAQGVLDALGKHVSGAAEAEQDLTKTQKQTTNAFADFSKQVGQTLLPAVEMLTRSLTVALKVIDSVGSAIASSAAITFHSVQGMGQAIVAAVSGHWKQLGAISAQTMAMIKNDVTKTLDDVSNEWGMGEQQKTAALLRGTNDRLEISAAARQRQYDADLQARQAIIAKAHEEASKLQQIEDQLDKSIASMHVSGLQRDKQVFAAEVQARKDAIEKDLKSERDKQTALAKLREFEAAGTKKLHQDEVLDKFNTSLQITDLAVQTLQTLNSMDQKSSESSRIRAKALLVLQQSVAIGWAVVASMKVTAETGNPAAGGALLAANIALIAAQTAQGFQRIDQSASQANSQLSNVIVNPAIPGVTPTGAQIPPEQGGGNPTQGFGSGRGGAPVSVNGGASVAGLTVHFNGGININGVNDASKIPDSVINQIGEKLLDTIKGQGQVGLTR